MKHGFPKLMLLIAFLLSTTLTLNGCIMAARKVHQELTSDSTSNCSKSSSSSSHAQCTQKAQ